MACLPTYTDWVHDWALQMPRYIDACHRLWLSASIHVRALPITVSAIVVVGEFNVAATWNLVSECALGRGQTRARESPGSRSTCG